MKCWLRWQGRAPGREPDRMTRWARAPAYGQERDQGDQAPWQCQHRQAHQEATLRPVQVLALAQEISETSCARHQTQKVMGTCRTGGDEVSASLAMTGPSSGRRAILRAGE